MANAVKANPTTGGTGKGGTGKGTAKWPWKRATCIIPGSDLSGVTTLDLIDVTLVTEIDGKKTEVPNLGLAFDSIGMTVKKPDGQPYARIPWVSIVQLSADTVRSRRNRTLNGVTLDVQSKRKHHRFFVPNVQSEALTGSLGAMSVLYGRGELVIGGPPRGMRRH